MARETDIDEKLANDAIPELVALRYNTCLPLWLTRMMREADNKTKRGKITELINKLRDIHVLFGKI